MESVERVAAMKILVIHSWGIGDLIMATPMLKSLHLSGHSVDLALFSAANATIVKGNDFLRKVILINSKADYLKLAFRYDCIVATAGMNPQKIRKLNLLLGAKKVYSAAQKRNVHRIEMNLRIVDELLTKRTKEPYLFIDNDAAATVERYIDKTRKNVGFCIGSGAKQRFKRWPGYKRLAKKIDGNVLVFIGPDEAELEKEFVNEDVVIVKESLENTVKLLSQLDLVVGNDNGLMHIAYAAKRDTVTVYGMTNEKETGGYYPNNEAVFLDMECRPCFDPSTDYVGCATFECLNDLSVESVWNVCRKFL